MSSDADTQRALSPLVRHLRGGMDSVRKGLLLLNWSSALFRFL